MAKDQARDRELVPAQVSVERVQVKAAVPEQGSEQDQEQGLGVSVWGWDSEGDWEGGWSAPHPSTDGQTAQKTFPWCNTIDSFLRLWFKVLLQTCCRSTGHVLACRVR